MKRVLLASAALLALWAITQVQAQATTIDPLQGVCSTCVEVGNVVTQVNQGTTITNFGFRSDPAQSGDLTLYWLVPSTYNLSTIPTVTGSLLGNQPTLMNGLFTAASGDFQTYTGLGGQPNNPYSAFVTSFEEALVPGVTASGFEVFSLATGNFSICNCATPSDIFSMGGTLPIGTEIIAILNNNGTNVFTAPSGTLQVNAVPGPIVGAGLPGLVAACLGLVGLARRRKRI